MWSLEVRNDFRNVTGCLKYQWYSPLAIFQEAYIVSGVIPQKVLPEDSYRVFLRGKEIGLYKDKETCHRQVLLLMESAPESCKDLCQTESRVLFDAIFGV
jgi:hypothetical protein